MVSRISDIASAVSLYLTTEYSYNFFDFFDCSLIVVRLNYFNHELLYWDVIESNLKLCHILNSCIRLNLVMYTEISYNYETKRLKSEKHS